MPSRDGTAGNSRECGNFVGGGLAGGGGIIVNSTIANNRIPFGGDARFATSALAVYNTIVSGQPLLNHLACFGRVTSLGNNLFSDPDCAVALLPEPGHGLLPLLRRSPAINAGDDAACLPADQRGRRRVGKSCDIGAIEGMHP